MKERNIIKFGIIILIAVILVQSLTLYIVYDKFDQNSLKIENVEKTIESEISSNKIEVQGQVDEITKVISKSAVPYKITVTNEGGTNRTIINMDIL